MLSWMAARFTWLALLVTLVLGDDACPPGFEWISDQNACVPCIIGQFKRSDGVCGPCEAGMFSALTGSSTCYACMSGTFADGTGNTHCSRCNAGSFSGDSGATNCSLCLPGSFQYSTGSSTCLDCGQGSCQPQSGSTSCLECSAGSSQGLTGASVCEMCSSGSFSWASSSTVCLECTAGTFQDNTGATFCEECPPGFFQSDVRGDGCMGCSAGWFQSARGSVGCDECGAGKFQFFENASSCQSCPAGTSQPHNGQTVNSSCIPCAPGSSSSEPGSSVCVECTPGNHQPEHGSLGCIPCSLGSFQLLSGGSDCLPCPVGTAGGSRPDLECPSCPVGLYSSSMGMSVCTVCDLGSFQSFPGSSSCSLCSAGTYQDRPGGVKCISCGPGTFSQKIGASLGSVCESCPAGYFSSGAGVTSVDSCSPCARGAYPAPDQSLCLECPDGAYYCPEATVSPIFCWEGLFCNGTDMDAAPGLLPYLRGNCSGVIPCPPGTLCSEGGEDKGLLVSPGRSPYFVVFLQGDLAVNGSCGEFSYGYERVDPLVDGIVEGLFYLRPRRCPMGSFLEKEECTLCPEGTFSQAEEALFMSSCKACGAGSFSLKQGATVCLDCQPGSFQDEDGASVCERCPVGAFQVDEGKMWCDPCPSGSFSPAVGQTECQTCPAGMIQSGIGMTGCTPCNGSSQFSSPGDSRCRSCGITPDALEGDTQCPPSRIPASQESIWVSVQGHDGDECAGAAVLNTGDLINTGTVRFFEWARCRRTLMVLGRPELSDSLVDPAPEGTQNVTRLRVVLFDQSVTAHSCQQNGFGFLFVAETEFDIPAVDAGDMEAAFSVMDPNEKHLLFEGICQVLPGLRETPFGRCFTSDFCPSMDVVVRVALRRNGSVFGKGRLAFVSGLQCPPAVAWLASFRLEEPFLTYFPGSLLRFRVSILNPPSPVVAFKFVLRIRPGFQFISFDGLGRERLEGDTLSVDGDSSTDGLELGTLVLRLDADHHGLLRAFQAGKDGFRVMLADGRWYSVGLQTDCFSCRRDGFAEVMVDYPRVTSLVGFVRRPWLVHWRSVQLQAVEFPLSVRVMAVLNNALEPKEVDARCRSGASAVLKVTSCADVRPRGAGKGYVRFEFMEYSTLFPVIVVQPVVTGVRVVSDASGRIGRVLVNASILGSVVDAGPFVLGKDSQISVGGSMHEGPWFRCHHGFEGTLSVGNPALVSWPCRPVVPGPSGDIVLFSGHWTSHGAFQLHPSVLSPSSDAVGIVFFDNDRLLSVGPLVSRDPNRAVVEDSGRLLLVRKGFSPRCVFVRDERGVGWGVHVLPPAPASLRVELSNSVLVVEQDLWKLVPSRASLKSASLHFSDGSFLDVSRDRRLAWVASSLLRLEQEQLVSALSEPGNASVSFRLESLACVNASVEVVIFPSSVLSGRIVCTLCPPMLAREGDPLGSQFPARFPAAIPGGLFVLRRRLVDGSVHDSVADLRVDGGSITSDGLVFANHEGFLNVSTALSDGEIVIPVVRRWTVKAILVCNGQVCDSLLGLTVPGDGAGLKPFNFPDHLDLSLELTLFNGTVLIFPWLDQVVLYANEVIMDPRNIRLSPGVNDLRVVFGGAWELDQPELSASLRVVTLSELRLDVPPILYQIHCSGIWDALIPVVVAVLSDGSSSSVVADLAVDGSVLGLKSGSVVVNRPGEGFVGALFGSLNVSETILVTLTSRLFYDISLESVPLTLEIPLGSRMPMHPVLFPDLSSRNNPSLFRRVVRWVVSVDGILDVGDGDGLTLLSDFHSVLKLSAVIRSCQRQPPVVVSKNLVVNAVPDKAGQIDVGKEHGPAFPVVAVNGRLDIPVFLFASQPLLSFHGSVSLEGTDQLQCLPGELPFSQCEVLPGGVVDLSGDFPLSQRVGRLLIGVLSGRVLLDLAAQVQVSIHEAVLDGLGDVGNVTWWFTVGLGQEIRQPLRSPLNRMALGVFPPLAELDPSSALPEGLEVCCNLTAVGERSYLERWVPSRFQVRSVSLVFNGSSQNISLLDIRIRVEYDEFVLRYDPSGEWVVLMGSELSEESTQITVLYFHPSSLRVLRSSIHVTLANVQKLSFIPAELVLYRIHCSSTGFLWGEVQAAMVVRGVSENIVLNGEDSTLENPAIASVSANDSWVSVVGMNPGSTHLVFATFGLQATCAVTVLDESIGLAELLLPNPYVLSVPLNGLERVRVSGVLDGGVILTDLGFLQPAVSVRGPVEAFGMDLKALGNTRPDSISSISVSVAGCSGNASVASTSVLVVRLAANLSTSHPADVLIEGSTDRFGISLVAPDAIVFAIELDTDTTHLGSCLVIPDTLFVWDCVLDFPRNGSLVLAGVRSSFVDSSSHLASVTPMPAEIRGVVEVYCGVSSQRSPVIAGFFGFGLGSPVPKPTFPVVDTSSIGRVYQGFQEGPWDLSLEEQIRFELGLITGRTRLIDVRSYSNENELSLMFRVTDRFLVPDETKTAIAVFLFADALPDHPDGVRFGGGMKVSARHVMDGWYAVQWIGTIPRLRLRFVYETSTSSSLKPWNTTVQDEVVTGRPLHACPRFATDDAAFRIVVKISSGLGPPAGFAGRVACAAHVAARRVSITSSGVKGMFVVSVDVESFIRIQQAREAIMNLSVLQNFSKSRRLLQEGYDFSIRYINDTADGKMACPPGFFFSSNGTYERLPQHAAVGADCYGMACLSGYVLLNEDCVPATVGMDVVWICLLVIGCLILCVSCVFCAVRMGKSSPPPEPVQMTPEPWPGVLVMDPFTDDEYGFKNVVIGSYLDEFSQDLLDDDYSEAVTDTRHASST